jgi:hypothetical protein
LNTWDEENGISTIPPCANTYSVHQDPYIRTAGCPVVYLNEKGEKMHAKRYYTHSRNKTVLLVKCGSFPASIIKHWTAYPKGWSEGWYVWYGDDRWETRPSVWRVAVSKE